MRSRGGVLRPHGAGFVEEAMTTKRKLRTLLEPAKVLCLQEKLQAGEIDEGECRELLKRMMLENLAGRRPGGRKFSFGHWFAKHAQGL